MDDNLDGRAGTKGKSRDNVHGGHRERMRKRYLAGGLDSFADHEVLEFLLFYCYTVKNTNPTAHKLINEFGSLANLFDASPHDIAKRCGVSMNVAILASLTPKLCKRYSMSKNADLRVLDTSDKAAEYVKGLFIGERVECFYLVCLNTKRQVISAEKLFSGTVNETPIYTREIVAAAVLRGATGVIMAHNHPSGIYAPSKSDLDATRRVIDALNTVNIDVYDHIIAANEMHYSFSERRTLPQWY